MTTLVCWIGVDSRGPSSIYIATDSRFTWSSGVSGGPGRKLSVRPISAEIIAFAGDVTIAQNMLLGLQEGPVDENILSNRLDALTRGFPAKDLAGTAIVFARRTRAGMSAQFAVSAIEFSRETWTTRKFEIPNVSDVVCAFGSGSGHAKAEVRQWIEASDRTSRCVFSGFCDALRKAKDPRTGPPA